VRLPEQGIHQRGLAMVHVGDDRDVPDIVPAVREGTSERLV